MVNQAKPIVEIFWTGGFDSTFRVVQLSQKNISIRPVYIHAANGRQSESYELAAIVKIYRKLVLHPKTIANFLPIRIVGGGEVYPEIDVPIEYVEMPQNETVQKAFYRMREKIDEAIIKQKGEIVRGTWNLNMPMRLADQYKATSSYANSYNVAVEVGVMKSDMFEYFGKVHKRAGVYRFLRNSADPDLYELFKNICFPLLKLKKTDIKKLYEKLGYRDIADMTWFCYNPIDGEPCGECPTCVPAYRDGMTHRFSAAAVQRYLAFEEREKILLGNSASKNIVKKRNTKVTFRKIIKYLLPYGFVRFYQLCMKK